MSHVSALPASKPWSLDLRLTVGLALAAMIAALAPFDRAFALLTLGTPALRALGIVGAALAGLAISRRIGLGVAPPGVAHPILFPVLVAAVTAAGCAALDLMFRPILHTDYLSVMQSAPLWRRTLGFMMRAFNENILYRLFLGSLLVWLIGRVWKSEDGRPRPGAFWAGFAVSQALNVWMNVTSLAPLTALSILHDTLRYFAPGMVWSWLFMRRGFQANEIASTSVHLFFQPLVGVLL